MQMALPLELHKLGHNHPTNPFTGNHFAEFHRNTIRQLQVVRFWPRIHEFGRRTRSGTLPLAAQFESSADWISREIHFVQFLTHVHLSCFFFSYLVAMAAEVQSLLRQRTGIGRWIILIASIAGLIAHSSYLLTRSLESGLPPLLGSSHDWLLVLAWLGVVLYVSLTVTHQRSTQGLLLLPVILVLIVMALFVDDNKGDGIIELSTRRWGMLHASTLALGIGLVVAATLTALMYMLQHQKLRGHSSMLHRFHLPNLEVLTVWNRRLVVCSVPTLAIGLVTGLILARPLTGRSVESTFRWSDPLVVGTIAVWAIMLITLFWILTRKDQTGRSVARLTLLAGGFLLVTIFGLMLLTGGIHGSADPDTEQPETIDRHNHMHESRFGQPIQIVGHITWEGHMP